MTHELCFPGLQAPDGNNFVRVLDGDFVVGCETFYPAMYNQYAQKLHFLKSALIAGVGHLRCSSGAAFSPVEW
jgi:hypothetical protein